MTQLSIQNYHHKSTLSKKSTMLDIYNLGVGWFIFISTTIIRYAPFPYHSHPNLAWQVDAKTSSSKEIENTAIFPHSQNGFKNVSGWAQ